MIHTVLQALIFIPAGSPLDSVHMQEGLKHIERHGYELFTIVRDWAVAVQLLMAGRVQVIVFARIEHCDREWTPRVEFVGQETREIIRHGKPKPRNDRPANAGDDRNRRPRFTR